MKKSLLLFSIVCFTTWMSVAQTWSTLPCPQSFASEISTCDSNAIWTASYGNLASGLSISSDNGNTWIHKDFPAFFATNNFNVGNLSAVNATTAYIIISGSSNQSLIGLYKTADAGDSWVRESTIFNSSSSFPDLVHFWDADNGFALGDGFEIFVYSSGSWIVPNFNNITGYSVNNSNFIRVVDDTILVLTGNGTLLKGTNYGTNWSELPTPYINDINKFGFDFKDVNNGILSFNNGTTKSLSVTTDGGVNWTSIGTNIPNLRNYITYVPSYNRYYSVGNATNPGLSYSDDNGITWQSEPVFDGVILGEMENASGNKVFLGGQNVIYSMEPEVSEHPDYAALEAIYNSTNGDTWTTNTNWLSNEPLSTWYGLTLQNDRVSRMILGSNNLIGNIPPEIGTLSELVYLGLYGNQLTGNIPSEIGNLTNLIELDLSPNTFTGNIPTEIGNLTNLEVLWLNNNGLTGTIPSSFQNLVNLRELYLMGAVASGSVWSSSTYSGNFPDLTALPLETLKLENNYFQFEDIVGEFDFYAANISNFSFSPQFTNDVEENLTFAPGSDIVLGLSDVSDTQGRLLTANTYQWYKDGMPISGANSNTYTIFNAQASDSGVYHCVITNADIPDFEIVRAAITLLIDPNLSIENIDLIDIKLYPNPVHHWMTIDLGTLSEAVISISDINGRILVSENLNVNVNVLDISNFQSGMYLVSIKSIGRTITKHIIKQ